MSAVECESRPLACYPPEIQKGQIALMMLGHAVRNLHDALWWRRMGTPASLQLQAIGLRVEMKNFSLVLICLRIVAARYVDARPAHFSASSAKGNGRGPLQRRLRPGFWKIRANAGAAAACHQAVICARPQKLSAPGRGRAECLAARPSCWQ